MSRSKEQSIKDRIKILAKEKNSSFTLLWQNLILERFLARLCKSKYKDCFVLKGGFLLARYIDLKRETYDLDFLVKKIHNSISSLRNVMHQICDIHLEDGFVFEILEINTLPHPQMMYEGIAVTLLAYFGNIKTYMHIDISFGNNVEPIEFSINLLSTKKAPLFESHIEINSYPKEFIFAEKLETVVSKGENNSRMKDYHDIHSMIITDGCLDITYAERIVPKVFYFRNTSIENLPLYFDPVAIRKLQTSWANYQRKNINTFSVPHSLKIIISRINTWLQSTRICVSQT